MIIVNDIPLATPFRSVNWRDNRALILDGRDYGPRAKRADGTYRHRRRIVALAGVCSGKGVVMHVPPPIGLPAPRQLPFVRRRNGYDYCTLCDLALEYCLCGTREVDERAPDSADGGLVKRIVEARLKAGGR